MIATVLGLLLILRRPLGEVGATILSSLLSRSVSPRCSSASPSPRCARSPTCRTSRNERAQESARGDRRRDRSCRGQGAGRGCAGAAGRRRSSTFRPGSTPKALAREAVGELKEAAQEIARDGLESLKRHPLTLAGAAAAVGLFLARGPLRQFIEGESPMKLPSPREFETQTGACPTERTLRMNAPTTDKPATAKAPSQSRLPVPPPKRRWRRPATPRARLSAALPRASRRTRSPCWSAASRSACLPARVIPRTEQEGKLLGPVGKRINDTAAGAAQAAKDAGKAELDALGLNEGRGARSGRQAARRRGQGAVQRRIGGAAAASSK